MQSSEFQTEPYSANYGQKPFWRAPLKYWYMLGGKSWSQKGKSFFEKGASWSQKGKSCFDKGNPVPNSMNYFGFLGPVPSWDTLIVRMLVRLERGWERWECWWQWLYGGRTDEARPSAARWVWSIIVGWSHQQGNPQSTPDETPCPTLFQNPWFLYNSNQYWTKEMSLRGRWWRQHCRPTVCSNFGWVWQILEQKQSK